MSTTQSKAHNYKGQYYVFLWMNTWKLQILEINAYKSQIQTVSFGYLYFYLVPNSFY